MHVVRVYLESISITTGIHLSTMPLYGIENDEISNIQDLQHSINSLIEKHEELYSCKIEEVQMVCDIFSPNIIRMPKMQNFVVPNGKMVTNNFVMKTCRVYELYDEYLLKALINCFTSIGINVERAWSVFSLFIQNSKELINKERTSILFIGRKETILCNFDGAGSVIGINSVNRGFVDIKKYINTLIVTKFPHVKHQVVTLILQNFIYFNEFEMIQKIQNSKNLNSGMMSFVNYDIVRFISSLLQKYLKQVWQDLQSASSAQKVVLYTQGEYLASFKKILLTVTMEDFVVISKDTLQPLNALKQRKSFVCELIDLFIKK